MNPTTQEKMKNKVSTIYDYLDELKNFSLQNLDHSRFLAQRILGTTSADDSEKPSVAPPISGILDSIIDSLITIKNTLITTREELEVVKKEIE